MIISNIIHFYLFFWLIFIKSFIFKNTTLNPNTKTSTTGITAHKLWPPKTIRNPSIPTQLRIPFPIIWPILENTRFGLMNFNWFLLEKKWATPTITWITIPSTDASVARALAPTPCPITYKTAYLTLKDFTRLHLPLSFPTIALTLT